MEIHRIRKEYTHFVDAFRRWSLVAGADVHVPNGGNVDVRGAENGQVEVRSLFHLASWPFKGASKKVNGLTVLVRTKEVYEDNFLLVKSNVNILYFKPTKKTLPMCPHTAIHYDYKFLMDDAHPIFHAQFGAKEIPADELLAVNFDRQLDLSAYEPIGSIRIPTVHVGLPAALLAVAADHLNKEAYYGFLEYTGKNVFFNQVAEIRLDKCREMKLHAQDQWVYRSHNVYM
jgi:hypothetical protein